MKNFLKRLFGCDIPKWTSPTYETMNRLLIQANEWADAGNEKQERNVFDLLWREVVDYRESLKPEKKTLAEPPVRRIPYSDGGL